MSTQLALPGEEYTPFGNVEARNGLQATLEIPLMIHIGVQQFGRGASNPLDGGVQYLDGGASRNWMGYLRLLH